MDENTLTNALAALQSARADFIQGLSKIDSVLASLNSTQDEVAVTPVDFADRLQELYANFNADDENLDEEEVIPSVTYDIDAEGNVVESEGAAELFDMANEALDEIHEAIENGEDYGQFGEFNNENRIELTFHKIDAEGEPTGTLTIEEVRAILTSPFTQNSLSNFGNLALTAVRPGEVEASKIAVLSIVNEGRAPIEALARQMMAYRGTYPFPGIGIISVVGRAVVA